MKPIVIFGQGDMAELAHYYFCHDSDRDVMAFTLDKDFIREEKFCGLPVIAFEEMEKHYPPETYDMFIALGYSGLNQLRTLKFNAARSRGYRMASYISSRATVLTSLELQENCFILEDNTIQPFVSIGENVVLWSGNHIGHHASIGNHCFITSHVVISGRVKIGDYCFIGGNAVIQDHLTIGSGCIIGMNAFVTENADAEGVYKAAITKRSSVPSYRLRKI